MKVQFEYRSQLERVWKGVTYADNAKRVSKSLLTVNPMNEFSSVRSSEFVKIEVFKKNEKTIGLRLPIDVLSRLEEFMEDGLPERLRKNGIDITILVNEAIHNGFPKGNLFSWSEGDKSVKITLE
jgi:hypothetical protein